MIIDVFEEQSLFIRLAVKIEAEQWVDRDTVIVNCAPNWSSRLSHSLSHLLSSPPLSLISLELPEEGMNQVWDWDSKSYRGFDQYLKDWCSRYIDKDGKYLFVNQLPTTGRTMNKIKYSLPKTTGYRFASLQADKDLQQKPDFWCQEFPTGQRQTFFWETKL